MNEDIIDVLHDLEENEIDVIYYTVNWHRVRKVKAEAISDLSVAEKLAEIEVKFKHNGNTLSELTKKLIKIEDRVTSQSDCVFNSFKLSIVVTGVEKVRDPSMWYSSVFIRKWRDYTMQELH